MQILVRALLLLLLPLTAFGQSSLPPCPPTGVKHNCSGSLSFASGRYEGEFQNDKPHGQGSVSFSSGGRYVGEFRDGQRNGQGLYLYPSGDRYVGEFRDGQRHGRGVYVYPGGERYVGEFREGKRHGQGVEYGAGGAISRSGQWSDGQLTQSLALDTRRFPFALPPSAALVNPPDAGKAERDRLAAEAASERARRQQLEAQLEAERRKRLEAQSQRGAESAPSTGTGFLVAPGLLITNQHVVADCERLEIVSPDGRRPARVVDEDDLVDLALVRVTGLSGPVAAIRRAGSVQLGEAAYAFGFPLAGLLSEGGNFTNGVVSSLRGMRESAHQIQITTPVQPGNSGGAVVDASGGVIGVVVAKLNAAAVSRATGDIPQNVNFAVSAQTLSEFLRKNAVASRSVERGTALDTAQLAHILRSFTHRVECSGAQAAAGRESPRAGTAPPEAARNTALWLINRAGESIFRVFVSATHSNTWGTDVLGERVVLNGDRFALEPSAAQGCVFDVRVEYKSGSHEEKRQQDFCALAELTFSGEGRRSPAPSAGQSGGQSGASNWTLVTSSSVGDEFYVDVSTIRRQGDERRFWTVLNFKTPLSSGARSTRMFREVDCRLERGRVILTTSFRGPMVTGELVGSNLQGGAWEFIAPGTVASTELRFVCAR